MGVADGGRGLGSEEQTGSQTAGGVCDMLTVMRAQGGAVMLNKSDVAVIRELAGRGAGVLSLIHN